MSKVYKFIGSYFIINIAMLAFAFAQNVNHKIIPIPVSYKSLNHTFILDSKTAVNFDLEEDEELKLSFLGRINDATGYHLAVSKSNKNVISFEKLNQYRVDLGEEGYELEVTNKKIKISANNQKGWFYGLETLTQLIPVEKPITKKLIINGALITDYPRFKYRGLMLDVSRHFFSVDVLKSYVHQMAKYKFNVLHLHLTDNQGWRIAINGLPKLTEVGAWRVSRTGYWKGFLAPQPNEVADYGGFYSYQQIKDLVNYASKNFVEIIPEVDVPGHSLALIASYPQLSCTQTPQKVLAGDPWNSSRTNVLCVGNDSVYVYLDKVFSEIAGLFPSQYIHIGGDEVTRNYWEKCEKCKSVIQKENLDGVEELQSYFIKKVTKIVNAKGKKVIGWNENLKGGLPDNMTVMSWKSSEAGINASNNSQFAIMTPAAFTYLDFYQGDPFLENGPFTIARLNTMYKFDPAPKEAKEDFILGGQGSLWTEQIPNERKLQYMTWPRALALSERLWSLKDASSWEFFVKRIEEHLPLFDLSNVKYSTQFYEPIIFSVIEDEVQKIKIISEIEELEIYYSFDDTSPDNFYPKYYQPLTVPKGAHHIRAISYKNGKPVGREINLPIEVVMKRK